MNGSGGAGTDGLFTFQIGANEDQTLEVAFADMQSAALRICLRGYSIIKFQISNEKKIDKVLSRNI